MIQTFRSISLEGQKCDHVFRNGIYDGFFIDGWRQDLSQVAAPFNENCTLDSSKAMLSTLGFEEIAPIKTV